MRRVFMVLGGRGFIGSSVVRALAGRARHRVISVDLSPVPTRQIGPGWKELRFDVGDTRRLINEMADADSVINLVGSSSGQSRSEMTSANVGATGSVVTAAQETNTHIVHVSSCAVYGMHDRPSIVDEESRIMPLGPYAESKAAGERLVQYALDSGYCRGLIFRPFTVVGPGQALRPAKPLLPALLDAAFGEHNFALQGDGEQARDFVSVIDVSRILAASALMNLSTQGAVNIGTGVSTTVMGLCRLVETVTGKTVRLTNADADRMESVRSSAIADTRRMLRLFPATMQSLEATIVVTARRYPGSSNDSINLGVSPRDRG